MKKIENLKLYRNGIDFFLILLFVLFCGCQFKNPKSQTNNLPEIDISKKYPKKEIFLQDIADIEYIALETSDDVLLGNMSILSYVSDNYICVYELMRGDIFVFNRNGEIISHFNHTGQGSQEYIKIGGAGVIFDEKNEEIIVCSYSFQVYSLSGEYKRTLKYNTDWLLWEVYNFDDETLLIYDEFRQNRNNYLQKPYMLMSKKDGSIVSVLDINLPIRYSNSIPIVDIIGGQKIFTSLSIGTNNRRYYGQDFVLADISSDTIYLLTQNRDLTPILVRTPSVHSTEPKTVWTTQLTTDKFILLKITTLDFIAAEKGRNIPPPVVLIHYFETGETYKVSIINVEYGMKEWNVESAPINAKNITANLFPVLPLVDGYAKRGLKGELEKFAATLDEDDNPIVMIIKFK